MDIVDNHGSSTLGYICIMFYKTIKLCCCVSFRNNENAQNIDLKMLLSKFENVKRHSNRLRSIDGEWKLIQVCSVRMKCKNLRMYYTHLSS